MKMTTALLIATGLAVPAAFAQSHAGMQPDSSSSMQSGSGASGTQSDWQSGGSSGASGVQSDTGSGYTPATARPQEHNQNGVAYLCGGVGQEEASYMKQEAKNYDLMLTFATRTGSYLADVDVDIKNAKGDSVLQANCDAPIMLIDLPRSGTYRIHAETSGYSLNRTARVAASRNNQRVSRVAMVWPRDVGGSEASTASGSSGEASSGMSGNGMEQDNGSPGAHSMGRHHGGDAR